MTRYSGIAMAIIAACALASCTSQPAMAPSHVSALDTGKLVIEQPGAQITIFNPLQEEQALVGGLGIAMGGAVGGAIVGMASTDSTKSLTVNVLAPYLSLIDPRSFTEEFYGVGKKAAASVPWFAGGPSQVALANEPGWISSERMKEITEGSGVGAVAFMFPHIAFSMDMKSLYIYAITRVYALNANGRVMLLDGGDLLAAARLSDTAPAPGASVVEKIATTKSDDVAALGARANLWFANDGARIRQALHKATKVLAVKLHNFLIGHRGTANPYKA